MATTSSSIRTRTHKTGGAGGGAGVGAGGGVSASLNSHAGQHPSHPNLLRWFGCLLGPPRAPPRASWLAPTAPRRGRTTAAVLVASTLLLLFVMLVRSSFDVFSSSLSGGQGGFDGGTGTGTGTGSGRGARPTTGASLKGGGAKKDLLVEKAAGTESSLACPYRSLRDLTDLERRPRATSTRHTIDPPRRPLLPTTTQRTDADEPDEKEEEVQEETTTSASRVTLVCCRTTKGPWSIVVHEAWAPLGAQRFLDMVNSQYFEGNVNDPEGDHGVPLMRCVRNFLCQFGLAGKKRSERFQASLKDDPQWLPEGPDHRINNLGVKRFMKGYMSYAGGGPNTRDNQLFVALADNGPLGGGSPWEVPWGELVGNHSYQTLDQIYTGYGEEGPSQHLLWHEHSLPVVRTEFPKLDWILSCHVVDEGIEE